MKPLTLAERVYLAKYYEADGSGLMAALFDKPYQAINQLIYFMKKSGDYELYRSLSDEEYEKILNCAEVKYGSIEEHDYK